MHPDIAVEISERILEPFVSDDLLLAHMFTCLNLSGRMSELNLEGVEPSNLIYATISEHFRSILITHKTRVRFDHDEAGETSLESPEEGTQG